MFGTQAQRVVLYAVAAAAFLSAPVAQLGRDQPGPGEAQVLITEENAASNTDPASLVSPFTQEEVVFRSSPDYGVLLKGEAEEEVVARALWRDGCAHVENAVLVMVPRSGSNPVRTLSVEVALTSDATSSPSGGADDAIDTRSDVPPTPEESVVAATAPCPVTLTVTGMKVDEATRGWLIRPGGPVPNTGANHPTEVLDVEALVTDYRVVRVISNEAYYLLGGTALAVAFISLAVRGALVKWGDQKVGRRSNQEPNLDALPVVTGAVGAFAAITTGALAWSDLAPDLHLGGIVVIALAGGLLVALGQATQGRPGLFFGVLGLALIALLVPLALLHGATIGDKAWWAWWLVAVLLALAVGWAASRPKQGQQEDQGASSAGGGQSAQEKRRPSN